MNRFVLLIALVLAINTPAAAQFSKALNATETPFQRLSLAEKSFLQQYGEANRWAAFYETEKAQLFTAGPLFVPEWTNLGPNTLDTLSGRMLCLTIHPDDPDVLFAGAGTGGLWKSENAGESWTALTDDLPSMRVSAVAINPNNPDEILIGTGIGQVLTTSLQPGIGVLKSTDGGISWSSTSFAYDLSDIVSTYKLVFDPFVANRVYLAATNGFYVSTDAGTTWTMTNPNRIYDIEVHPTEAGTIFIGTQFVGVQRSTNSGQSWTTLSNGIPSGSQVFRVDVAICSGSPEVLVAKLISGSGFGTLGVYRSGNGGNSWSALPAGPQDVACQPSNPSACSGWLFNTIGIAPDDPDKIYLGGVQFWYTHDGGQNWIWKDYASNGAGNNLGNLNLVYVDHWDIDFDTSQPGRMYVCCDGGVIRSDDYGETWTRMSNDLINAMVYTSATHPDNPDFMIGGFHDHGLQRLLAADGNLTWTRWSNNDGIQTIIDPDNDGVVYGNIQNGGVIKSFTNGDNSTTSYWVNQGIQESGPWNSPLVMDPQNSSILYTASTAKIYKTTNGALNWSSVANISNVRTLEIDPHQTSRVYAHAFAGGGWALYRTANGGSSWSNINHASIPTWGVTALVADPHQEGRLYATRNSTFPNQDHIKVSNDFGDTWTDITNDLPDIRVNDLLVSPYDPNHLFLATDLGVYFSDNAGQNWCTFNNNLPRIYTMDLHISAADSTLRVATFGRGVWKTSLQELLEGTVSLNTPSSQTAISLHPNPAREFIHLTVSPSSAAPMRVSLYDLEGRKIKQLLHYQQPQANLDAQIPLPPGLAATTYILRITVGHQRYHRKVVVVE